MFLQLPVELLSVLRNCDFSLSLSHTHTHTHTRTHVRVREAPYLLRSWVRIPPGACCECHVLSGRGLCDELITRPEESYRLWCVIVCYLETSRIGAPYIYIYIYIYDVNSLRVNLHTCSSCSIVVNSQICAYCVITWTIWHFLDNFS